MLFRILALCGLLLECNAVLASTDKCGHLTSLFENTEHNPVCIGDYVSVRSANAGEYLVSAYLVSAYDVWKNPRYRDYDPKLDLYPQANVLSDRAKSLKWDYGHLANEKIADSDVKARFLGANRIPMSPDINRNHGAWHELEKYEIDMARRFGNIDVIAGYISNTEQNRHHYFKIYLNSEHIVTASYLMTAGLQNWPLESLITSISCIEQLMDKPLLSSSFVNHFRNDAAFSTKVWTAGNTPLETCNFKWESRG